MAQQAALTVRRNFPRPDPAKVRRFDGVPTGFVVDAQGRQGAMFHHIRPLTHNQRFAGTALCVRTRSRDNLAPWAALEHAKPGDVLVVATGGTEDASTVGDLLIGMAANCGVVAMVIDGLVRDVAGLNEVGIPVFGLGVSPNSPFKDGPGEIGLAVSLGGVTVQSGDVVLGDPDGVVVVPQGDLDAVLEELEAVKAKEAEMDKAVKGGQKLPSWLPEALNAKGVRYLD